MGEENENIGITLNNYVEMETHEDVDTLSDYVLGGDYEE